MSPPMKKLRSPGFSPFEALQLLFEAFFDILKNKQDIQKERLSSKYSDILYRVSE